MKRLKNTFLFVLFFVVPNLIYSQEITDLPLPRSVDSYADGDFGSLLKILLHRIQMEPLNIIATIIFICAIIHMFMARKLYDLAYRVDRKHRAANVISADADEILSTHGELRPVSFSAQILYFLGEIEVIFMIWVIPLAAAISIFYGWEITSCYINSKSYAEPLLVVVIMLISATRPILSLASKAMKYVANLMGGSPMAWWLSILTLGPLLGSLITEPGAITISAILLANQFYRYNPTTKFAYATMGLLFVNISVGGVLTHFAAPPVLMVARAWNWDTPFMLMNFGWKAVLGILISNSVYAIYFRKEFSKIKLTKLVQSHGDSLKHLKTEEHPTPLWISAVHIFMLYFTIRNEHYPVVFVGAFLLFLGFHQATRPYQSKVSLKPAILLGCFLSGLIIHGSLQGWWIDPILDRLSERTMLISTVIMTAFNDNAAITYLSTFNTGFTPALRYAVVAGAVAGGGLTVMANSPNPAGQMLLKKFFHKGVAPLHLFLGALTPTLIQVVIFTITA